MMLSKDNTHLRESLDFLTQESRFLVSEEQFLLLRETNGLTLEYPTQVCDCTVLVHRTSFDPNLPYLVTIVGGGRFDLVQCFDELMLSLFEQTRVHSLTLNLLIPNSMAGWLIGKKAMVTQDLRELSFLDYLDMLEALVDPTDKVQPRSLLRGEPLHHAFPPLHSPLDCVQDVETVSPMDGKVLHGIGLMDDMQKALLPPDSFRFFRLRGNLQAVQDIHDFTLRKIGQGILKSREKQQQEQQQQQQQEQQPRKKPNGHSQSHSQSHPQSHLTAVSASRSSSFSSYDPRHYQDQLYTHLHHDHDPRNAYDYSRRHPDPHHYQGHPDHHRQHGNSTGGRRRPNPDPHHYQGHSDHHRQHDHDPHHPTSPYYFYPSPYHFPPGERQPYLSQQHQHQQHQHQQQLPYSGRSQRHYNRQQQLFKPSDGEGGGGGSSGSDGTVVLGNGHSPIVAGSGHSTEDSEPPGFPSTASFSFLEDGDPFLPSRTEEPFSSSSSSSFFTTSLFLSSAEEEEEEGGGGGDEEDTTSGDSDGKSGDSEKAGSVDSPHPPSSSFSSSSSPPSSSPPSSLEEEEDSQEDSQEEGGEEAPKHDHIGGLVKGEGPSLPEEAVRLLKETQTALAVLGFRITQVESIS